jgi:uncharacterized protein (TIGR03067 family)
MSDADAEHDLLLLQGTWKQFAFEQNGVDDPPDDHGAPNSLTTIKGRRYSVHTAEGDLILEGSFELDAAARPGRLVWTDDDGPLHARSLECSYRVDHERFVCSSPRMRAPRARLISPTPGSARRCGPSGGSASRVAPEGTGLLHRKGASRVHGQAMGRNTPAAASRLPARLARDETSSHRCSGHPPKRVRARIASAQSDIRAGRGATRWWVKQVLPTATSLRHEREWFGALTPDLSLRDAEAAGANNGLAPDALRTGR